MTATERKALIEAVRAASIALQAALRLLEADGADVPVGLGEKTLSAPTVPSAEHQRKLKADRQRRWRANKASKVEVSTVDVGASRVDVEASTSGVSPSTPASTSSTEASTGASTQTPSSPSRTCARSLFSEIKDSEKNQNPQSPPVGGVMGWRSAEVIRSPEATVTAQPSGAPIAAQPVRRRRHDRQAVVDAGSVGEPIQRVWQAYAEVVGDRVVLTAARVELIRSRLSGWSADELVECVKGYGTSRFHFGENDRGRRYVDLELWLRDAQHVESGLRMWRDQKRSGAKARSATDAAPKSDMEAKWDEFFKHNPEGVYVFPRVTKGESDAQQH